ncbi:hypothetical protein [Streptomyces sp. NPDC005438]|uniref:hypothetical protein n=1 Tax=Streptomyces sp. NPDC005438 TaxID=3156880 RepID=UPI0033A7C8F7
MTFEFAAPPHPESPHRGRILEPAEWASTEIPLLRDPRRVITELHALHRPRGGDVVVAVLRQDQRPVASASFSYGELECDGWVYRNALLHQLRRVIPHDLRRRSPSHTAILLCARAGDLGWTPEDGAWLWGLRDACTLHGLRCGAYVTLGEGGWQVLGEGRTGRRPSVREGPLSPLAVAPPRENGEVRGGAEEASPGEGVLEEGA